MSALRSARCRAANGELLGSTIPTKTTQKPCAAMPQSGLRNASERREILNGKRWAQRGGWRSFLTVETVAGAGGRKGWESLRMDRNNAWLMLRMH